MKGVERTTRQLVYSKNTKDAVYVWNRTNVTFYAILHKNPAGFLEVEIRTQEVE